MVFSPRLQKLYCPYCDGTDCDEQKGDESMVTCPSCGGAIEAGSYTSATRCPSCGNHIIFDVRVRDEYRPDVVIPFKLEKEDAVEALEKEFGSRPYTPTSFLSEKSLVNLTGYYVPFFLYDYHADYEYDGEGTKTRSWRQGDYIYTEVSHFKLLRRMKADYSRIPADASIQMPDETMDLLEPYDYQLLTDFDPRYMSGFFGEIYNLPADELTGRAEAKARESAEHIMQQTLTDYKLRSPDIDSLSMDRTGTEFALFPVWKYTYRYDGQDYDFHVNGQTGKVIGKTPVSKLKVALYGLTCAGLWALIIDAVLGLLEVLQ